MKKYLIYIFVIFLFFEGPAHCSAPEWTERESYWSKVGGKLEYGVTNTLAGWTALFTTPMSYADNNQNVLKGIGAGIGKAFVYTGGGLVNFLTFPAPFNFPIPDNGVNLES